MTLALPPDLARCSRCGDLRQRPVRPKPRHAPDRSLWHQRQRRALHGLRGPRRPPVWAASVAAFNLRCSREVTCRSPGSGILIDGRRPKSGERAWLEHFRRSASSASGHSSPNIADWIHPLKVGQARDLSRRRGSADDRRPNAGISSGLAFAYPTIPVLGVAPSPMNPCRKDTIRRD